MATVPPRWFHAASAVGSTIYFTGGTTHDNSGKAVLLSDTIGLDLTQPWDTSNPTLSTLASVPGTVSGHVMGKISATTQLLIAGGESNSPQASFTYLFDTKAGSWSVVKPATPTPPNHRLFSAAVVTGKDGLLLEGGYATTVANGTFSPSLISLNPSANFQPVSTTPVALAANPPALARHTMTLTTDGQAVILGGITPQGAIANMSVAYVLDTQANKGEWKAVPLNGTAPDPRMSFSTVLVNTTTLLVYGGTNDLKSGFSNSFYLDLPSWTWSSPPVQGNAPSLWGHTATMAGNFMIVGFGTSSTPSDERIALLDVVSNTWTNRFRPVGQYIPVGDPVDDKKQLSVGAVLGIAFVITAFIIGGAFYLLVRRRKRQTRNTLARQNMGDHTARSAVRSSSSDEKSLIRKLASLLGIRSGRRDDSRRSVRYSDMQLHSNAMAISSRMTQMGYSPVSLGYPENVVEHGSGNISVSSYIYPNQACVETEKEIQDGQETQIVYHTLTQAQQEALKLSKQPMNNKSKLYSLDY
ncbi:Serine/threonine-protein phosphatase bsl1 [Linnemannia zychae]|nr:Serine/threonine-protein phosphatase bsl1 [Linnemannia zychae]